MKIHKHKILALLSLSLAALNGCNSQDLTSQPNGKPSATLPDTSSVDPQNPASAPSDQPTSGTERPYTKDVLLFNGVGISTSDWQTTEEIVKAANLTYDLVNSSKLDAMTLDQMASYGLMIFPGGYGNQITAGVSAATGIRVRQAVRDRGVSFLGICAGAWVAVGPESSTDQIASYGFAVAQGRFLDEYLPGGFEPTAAMVDVSFADQSHRSLVWWGGPITPNWENGVVARYTTGDPAISQTWSGKGFVIVTGPHPEAPQGWRSVAGNDPDGLDYDIATKLIKAALNRQPLPVF